MNGAKRDVKPGDILNHRDSVEQCCALYKVNLTAIRMHSQCDSFEQKKTCFWRERMLN